MPCALEALDSVLADLDGGKVKTSAAIEQLLGAQIALRNNRRLVAVMSMVLIFEYWRRATTGSGDRPALY